MKEALKIINECVLYEDDINNNINLILFRSRMTGFISMGRYVGLLNGVEWYNVNQYL